MASCSILFNEINALWRDIKVIFDVVAEKA